MKRIVLDPGHGLPDPGAVNKNLRLTEAELALQVSQAVSVMLKAEGYNVRSTRQDGKAIKSDKSADLTARCKLANDWGADAFVSIHFNSSGSGKASGIEVFHYYNKSDKLSASIGKSLRKSFPSMVYRLASGGSLSKPSGSNGIKSMAVLRQTEMPAVLIECAFIDNDTDILWFLNADNVKRFANAIVNGIKAWDV